MTIYFCTKLGLGESLAGSMSDTVECCCFRMRRGDRSGGCMGNAALSFPGSQRASFPAGRCPSTHSSASHRDLDSTDSLSPGTVGLLARICGCHKILLSSQGWPTSPKKPGQVPGCRASGRLCWRGELLSASGQLGEHGQPGLAPPQA